MKENYEMKYWNEVLKVRKLQIRLDDAMKKIKELEKINK